MLARVRAQVWLNPTATEYADGEGEAAAASASCCLKCLPAATVSERSKKLEHSRIASFLSIQLKHVIALTDLLYNRGLVKTTWSNLQSAGDDFSA
jgi:hypothetical protein